MASADARVPYERLATAQRRRLLLWAVLRVAGSVTVLVAIYYLLPLDRRSASLTLAGLFMGLAVLVSVIVWQVKTILTAAYPTVRAVEALAIIVPLFLLSFATAYFVMAQASDADFTQRLSRTDSLYFAVTVFSTVGFGDITARSEAARIVVTVQMIADLVAIGVGLRVIVGAVKVAQQRTTSG